MNVYDALAEAQIWKKDQLAMKQALAVLSRCRTPDPGCRCDPPSRYQCIDCTIQEAIAALKERIADAEERLLAE